MIFALKINLLDFCHKKTVSLPFFPQAKHHLEENAPDVSALGEHRDIVEREIIEKGEPI
jgi:hypothetical protein